MEQENINLLLEFLNMPINSGEKVFEKFKTLNGAVYSKGENSLENYLYIPGTRKDRIVLIAHTDTVWDKSYGKEITQNVLFNDGKFYGENEDCGIGADDRAGCAMLWKLRDSGHSLLLVDGEEHGKIGSKYLKKSNPKLYKELNNHCFMLELDHKRTNHVSYVQVDNSKKFKKYIEYSTPFVDLKESGGCDLQILCNKICGANICVGYINHHTNKEKLILSEWENTYFNLESFLKKPQKKYKSLSYKKYIRFIKRCIVKLLKILKIKK